ncbi:MAG TPA: class I SAM-dependent methyltransferase [Spirochaetota bacterium]|nr:class I SAM-dependent methyltransferase [Spirochaetota bacterium]HNT11680.1 class I SAM-dependent methyltransferase [Spirochaetota bacterium]
MKRPMLLSTEYFPKKDENLMSDVGDVARAREQFLRDRPANLEFLLRKRYAWMNEYIRPGDAGIEVGCGHGLGKLFITSPGFMLTDYADHPWIEKKVDALNMPFGDSSLDYIVSSNMIHHLATPHRFFTECSRVLRTGGMLIVQEINASLAMRAILRVMRHEGYSYDVDVFSETSICNDLADLWSANCAIPNLLFDDIGEFERRFPFRAVHQRYTEFLVFPLSGGVIAKKRTVNLPVWLLRGIDAFDDLAIMLSRRVFPLQRRIVLRNEKLDS